MGVGGGEPFWRKKEAPPPRSPSKKAALRGLPRGGRVRPRVEGWGEDAFFQESCVRPRRILANKKDTAFHKPCHFLRVHGD